MKKKLPCVKSAGELGITKGQRRNLAKLTAFVNTKVEPPKFDIKHYNSDSLSIATDEVSCGTTACFCGYGPLAGIAFERDSYGRADMWGGYARKAFGAELWSCLYNLLFDAKHKNTKEAAVLRGAYFLMHGYPKNPFLDEYEYLRTWEVPANFQPNWHSIRAVASAK